jgi:hypothetical protein
MDPGVQFLFLCNPGKQCIELKPFLLIKSRANGVVVFTGDSPNLLRCGSARSSQMQRIRSSVFCILPALNESFFLKFIKERHKAARKDCKAPAKLLLTKPWRQGDKP